VSDTAAHRRGDIPADLDDMTALVLGVFGEVLGMERIAEDDHFFDACSGTSVQAWWAISDIEDSLGVDMEFKEFLGAPTARETAALLLGIVEAQRPAAVARR